MPAIPLIVQARTLSTRFPRKVLQPFGGQDSLLSFQLDRLKKAFPSATIVVATTDQPADGPIEEMAAKNEVLCYRGSETDVLDRFLQCCKEYGFSGHIARVCSDNPFLQMDLLKNMIQSTQDAGADTDYISYRIGETPAIRTHFGFFAEIVSVRALERTARLTGEAVYREHVTNFIYKTDNAGTFRTRQEDRPEEFRIQWIALPELLPYLDTIRLTIDSPTDFTHAAFVYNELINSDASADSGPFSWRRIAALIENNPTIKNEMINLIRSSRK